MHPPSAWRGLKKSLLGVGGQKFLFWLWGLYCCGGLILFGGGWGGGGGRVHVNLKEKLKLHNASIKTIFGITNLIYFRDI